MKAKENASILARAVRDGLTAHMVNGIMAQRYSYLDSVQRDQQIENIRVVRSNSVINQYGSGEAKEITYDTFEKQALNSGKEISKFITKNGNKYMRVTIPYIATATSQPNCITCHQAKIGDVLGAISMEVSVDDVLSEGEDIILKVLGSILLIALIAILIANFYIKPYVKLFSDLEDGIQKAYHGNFDYNIQTKLTNEAGVVANRLNDLSSIFLFKKTIENDLSKESIYQRILYVMKNKFYLENVAFFEVCEIDKSKTKLYGYGYNNDDEKLKKFITSNECRASRTNKIVLSSDFNKICDNCILRDCEYACIPFAIGKEKHIILNVEFSSKKELTIFKENIPIISNYIETAKPVLETKILLEKLEEKTLTDPLTGLSNRRFLENYISSHLENKNFFYSVLMIDIDFFKKINDTYGHDMGDKVLKKLSEVLIRNIKGIDVACRYGGEEFTIILVDANKDAAVKIAENIRNDFATQRFEYKEEFFTKTLSIGVATFDESMSDHWHTIKCADDALYVAKNSGRNKVSQYEVVTT
jgi:diguanylate cyclase (GGDEF)-like protein